MCVCVCTYVCVCVVGVRQWGGLSSVCLSVCLSVCQKDFFHESGWPAGVKVSIPFTPPHPLCRVHAYARWADNPCESV